MRLSKAWLVVLLALVVAGCSGGTDEIVNLVSTTNVSLAVTPANPTLAPGASAQLSAMTNDGRDFTSQATWTSSNPNIVSVSNDAGTKGQITASVLSGGEAVITASFSGLGTATTVTVTGARLLGISINPGRSTTIVGFHRNMVALGTFDDGSVQSITNTVTWASENQQLATVSAAGRLVGVAEGDTNVTASFGGFTATAPVEISAAPLTGLLVSPTMGSSESPEIATGDIEGFTASGFFDDGTVLDVTEEVSWSSSDPVNAPVSNADGSQGEVTGNVAGTYFVTATLAPASPEQRRLDVVDGALDYTERRIPFDWRDIRNTGRLLMTSDDQARSLPEGQGFDFTYFGSVFRADQIFASTNILLSFGSPNASNEDGPLPSFSQEGPGSIVALYWGDMVTDVYFEEFGTAPNRTMIVQWNGSPWQNPESVIAVQAVLTETSNVIDLRYLSPSNELGSGESDGATAGLQNSDGSVGTTHSTREQALFHNSAWRYAP